MLTVGWHEYIEGLNKAATGGGRVKMDGGAYRVGHETRPDTKPPGISMCTDDIHVDQHERDIAFTI